MWSKLFSIPDKRQLWLVVGLGFLAECIAFNLFSNAPLDVEPLHRQSQAVAVAQVIAIALHFPALPLLTTPLTNYRLAIQVIFFLVGFFDLMIFLAGISIMNRLIRFAFSRQQSNN